ncbi:MAG: glycosyltransferase family 2 protein [Bacteroidales bacterium]
MNKVSVLMPVYNAEKYMAEAIESTLNQSFTNFEFIIVDDASTDNTLAIIDSYKDSRIQLIKAEHSLVKSLNIGLKAASGEYIARMDADDIMHTDRLKIQYSLMEEEEQITVCSSWMKAFGTKISGSQLIKSNIGMVEYPLLLLLRGNFVFHPTVMIRNSFLKEKGLKYRDYIWAEDYKLWVDIAEAGGRFFIDSEPLLLHRISDEQVRNTKQREQAESTLKIKREILTELVETSDIEKLQDLLTLLDEIKDEGFLSDNEITTFFYTILQKRPFRHNSNK